MKPQRCSNKNYTIISQCPFAAAKFSFVKPQQDPHCLSFFKKRKSAKFWLKVERITKCPRKKCLNFWTSLIESSKRFSLGKEPLKFRSSSHFSCFQSLIKESHTESKCKCHISLGWVMILESSFKGHEPAFPS